MGTPRRSDQRTPRLAMPEVVVLRAPPATTEQLRQWGTPYPTWQVAVRLGEGAPVRGTQTVMTTDGVHVPLRVLVRPPSWAVEIDAAVIVRGQLMRLPSMWGPCIIVPPERHDPDRGWYSLSDFPLITFDGGDRGSLT